MNSKAMLSEWVTRVIYIERLPGRRRWSSACGSYELFWWAVKIWSMVRLVVLLLIASYMVASSSLMIGVSWWVDDMFSYCLIERKCVEKDVRFARKKDQTNSEMKTFTEVMRPVHWSDATSSLRWVDWIDASRSAQRISNVDYRGQVAPSVICI